MKAGLTAIISALLLAAACDPGPPRAVNLQVDLAWDAAGAALAQDMATITSDTGYVVELDRLAVTTYSVELMPCDPRPAPKRTTLNIIGTAWAGHQAGHPTTRTNTTGFEVPPQDRHHSHGKIRAAGCGLLFGALPDRPAA